MTKYTQMGVHIKVKCILHIMNNQKSKFSICQFWLITVEPRSMIFQGDGKKNECRKMINPDNYIHYI